MSSRRRGGAVRRRGGGGGGGGGGWHRTRGSYSDDEDEGSDLDGFVVKDGEEEEEAEEVAVSSAEEEEEDEFDFSVQNKLSLLLLLPLLTPCVCAHCYSLKKATVAAVARMTTRSLGWTVRTLTLMAVQSEPNKQASSDGRYETDAVHCCFVYHSKAKHVVPLVIQQGVGKKKLPKALTREKRRVPYGEARTAMTAALAKAKPLPTPGMCVCLPRILMLCSITHYLAAATAAKVKTVPGFKAKLHKYQQVGFSWLVAMHEHKVRVRVYCQWTALSLTCSCAPLTSRMSRAVSLEMPWGWARQCRRSP